VRAVCSQTHSPKSSVYGHLQERFSPSREGAKKDSGKILFATLAAWRETVFRISGVAVNGRSPLFQHGEGRGPFYGNAVCRPGSLSALRQSRTFCHTESVVQKIAVTLDQRTVADLDRWVREGRYPNRSRALQSAVNLLSEREKRTRLARELAKIDPREEMQLAEQGLGDQAWPEY
jgi:Arc/MetJ-type ribon-helix-helix transcriptional regulator